MIAFDELSKRYELGSQHVQALSGVSGSVAKGEMLALRGPSGSGKSTLLNILGLLDLNYQGQVTLDGVAYPRDALSAAKLRRTQFGFVFQRFNLVPVMNCVENVAFPLRLNGVEPRLQIERAEQMLSKLGLGDYLTHRPDHLSGGQQQRVAIARALIHRPSIVIADEPTASLDSHTANTIVDVMRELGHELNTTFVIATHDARMVSRCDRAIELTDGRVLMSQQGVAA